MADRNDARYIPGRGVPPYLLDRAYDDESITSDGISKILINNDSPISSAKDTTSNIPTISHNYSSANMACIDTLYSGPICLMKDENPTTDGFFTEDCGLNIVNSPENMFTPYVSIFSDTEKELEQQKQNNEMVQHTNQLHQTTTKSSTNCASNVIDVHQKSNLVSSTAQRTNISSEEKNVPAVRRVERSGFIESSFSVCKKYVSVITIQLKSATQSSRNQEKDKDDELSEDEDNELSEDEDDELSEYEGDVQSEDADDELSEDEDDELNEYESDVLSEDADDELSEYESDVLSDDDEEIPIARSQPKRLLRSFKVAATESSEQSDEEKKKKRKLKDTSISPLDRKSQKSRKKKTSIDNNNKSPKKKQAQAVATTVRSPLIEEKCRKKQQLSIVFPEDFRKSETFDRPEFLLWLKSNQHLRTISDGVPKICELLDQIRIENPTLNEIFLALADNDEKVNPYFFDIARLVRPNDSLIFPPEWQDRTDLGATYIWSFDLPIKDLQSYCEEIEKHILDNPHCDTDTIDYRLTIVKQFRNFIEHELPVHEKAEVLHWLYVGQTEQSPPFRRWIRCYKRKGVEQPVLRFAMCNLVEKKIPHRLVVASSDGTPDMEAAIAGLLNIRIVSGGGKGNAINRAVCGHRFGPGVTRKPDKHTLAIAKFNNNTEMIICVHCKKELFTNPEYFPCLLTHACSALGIKKRRSRTPQVYCRLFTQSKWCPNKDSCEACAVIVPRDDITKDLPLEEILQKNKKWKKERQQFVLSTFDNEKNKIICVHCGRAIKTAKDNPKHRLRHICPVNSKRSKSGNLLEIDSNLFYVHEWCSDEMNCKSCIQIIQRGEDPGNYVDSIEPQERQRQVLRSFDYDSKKIICVHCGKNQTPEKACPTTLNSHRCLSGKQVGGSLYRKTNWCPDANCKECLIIVNRHN